MSAIEYHQLLPGCVQHDVEGGNKDESTVNKLLTFLCVILKPGSLGPTIPLAHFPCMRLSECFSSESAVPIQLLGT